MTDVRKKLDRWGQCLDRLDSSSNAISTPENSRKAANPPADMITALTPRKRHNEVLESFHKRFEISIKTLKIIYISLHQIEPITVYCADLAAIHPKRDVSVAATPLT